MPRKNYRVFVSHGWADRWVAEQIARRLHRDCGCEIFIDVFDVAKGDEFEARIFDELPMCDELAALLTPWSAQRNWLWVEMGAARLAGLRIVPILYGLTLAEIDKDLGGKTFLGGKNMVDINDLESYLAEAAKRTKR